MKILILANNDVGLYQFRKELIEALIPGNEIYISLPNGEFVEPLKQMGCVFFETPIDRRGMNPFRDMGLFLSYGKMLKKLQPDLVITYTVKPNVYGGFASRLLRIPYAVNITGLGTAFQSDGLLRKIVTVMYRLGCRKARVVFFENSENRRIFLDEKIVKEEQTCLLNGAGVNLSHYQVSEYPEGDTTRFLFIGRVMREKGIEELFEAMKRLHSEGVPCTLDVLGGYEEDYQQLIEDYTAEGWLHYHGYQADVRPFIADSHCFVLPSWHEGMANTNLECAASGRPVITSKIHGCLEAVEDGITGFLCEKRNPEDLYRVMKQFTELPYEARKSMGLSGRKRMEMLFDKKQVVEKTIVHLMK